MSHPFQTARDVRACAKCGGRNHVEADCFMNSRALDTATLGPIKVPTPTHRQQDAKLVREAFEAAYLVVKDGHVALALRQVAQYADTETLAYIRRLLKG